MITGSPEQDAVLHAALTVGLNVNLNDLAQSHYGDRTDSQAASGREHVARLQSALDALLTPPIQPTHKGA